MNLLKIFQKVNPKRGTLIMEDKKTAVADFARVIGGVKVQFPVKPYPSQMAMMALIIKGLKRRQNCLLESPTGSGKSLALLCSTLAWLNYEEGRIKKFNELIDQGITDPDVLARLVGGPPIPIETNLPAPDPETGSGLLDQSTAAQETESSTDEHKAAALASEETSQDAAPNALQGGFLRDNDFTENKNTFRFPANSFNETADDLDTSMDDMLQPILLQARLSKLRVPKIFFGTRTHKQLAQVIRELKRTQYASVRMAILGSREHTCIHPMVSTMPNKNEGCKALLDGVDGDTCLHHHGVSRLRSFDQLSSCGISGAYDIEELVKVGRRMKACPYFTTKQLIESAQVIFAPYNYLVDPLIRESMNINVQNSIIILDEAHNIEDSAREAASFSLTQDATLDAMHDLEKMAMEGVKPESCQPLVNTLSSLSQWMDANKNNLTDYSEYDRSGKIFSGYDMLTILKNMDIGASNLSELTSCLYKLNEESDPDEQVPKPLSATSALLKGFFLILKNLFKENTKYCTDYKVALVKEQTYGNPALKDASGWISRRKKSVIFVYSLNFWCLNPGVAFRELGEGSRSIILTSGTLSPMNSFQSELGVQFPIQLEANHVISKDQVWVGTISKGPTDKVLNATYRSSETWAFQDELGKLILAVCEVVPKGVLCFVTSYSMLNKLVDRWQTTGLWDKLNDIKTVFTEPRKSSEFESTLTGFYEAVKTDSCDGPNGGAFLIAVCRGKVSEGMDFTDDNARAVIAVGIPFPNVKDIQMGLKRQFNNTYYTKRGLLSGSEWYEIQAYRALNQALGRCIRHRYDWGALILVDERFQQKGWKNTTEEMKYTKGLSKWVRKLIQHEPNFEVALGKLKAFAENMTVNPPKPVVKAAEASNDRLTPTCNLSTSIVSKYSTDIEDSTSSQMIASLSALRTDEPISSTFKHPLSKTDEQNPNESMLTPVVSPPNTTANCFAVRSPPDKRRKSSDFIVASANKIIELETKILEEEKDDASSQLPFDDSRFSYASDEDMFADADPDKRMQSWFDSKTPQAATVAVLAKNKKSSKNTVKSKKPFRPDLSSSMSRKSFISESSDSDLENFNLNKSTPYAKERNAVKRKRKRKGIEFTSYD